MFVMKENLNLNQNSLSLGVKAHNGVVGLSRWSKGCVEIGPKCVFIFISPLYMADHTYSYTAAPH